MKVFIATLLMLMLMTAGASAAEVVADGLYRLAKGAPSPVLRSMHGEVLFIGERQEVEVRAEWLLSTNNANTEFSLGVVTPRTKAEPVPYHVLVVDGVAYPNTSGDSASLGFQISGEANARQVSRYLGFPISLRHHPGHQLRTTLTPTKPVFASGEQVAVTMEITNLGPKPVSFMRWGFSRGANRDNQYTFSAYLVRRPVPDIGNNNNMGGTGAPHELLPDATFTETINLSRWFDFKEPGVYEVHGSYLLRFVEPRGELLQFIWLDYASGKVQITIE